MYDHQMTCVVWLFHSMFGRKEITKTLQAFYPSIYVPNRQGMIISNRRVELLCGHPSTKTEVNKNISRVDEVIVYMKYEPMNTGSVRFSCSRQLQSSSNNGER